MGERQRIMPKEDLRIINNKKPNGVIPELEGHRYVYGVPNQDQKYLKTTDAIGDQVGVLLGKEYKDLVVYRKEPEYKEPEAPKTKSKETAIAQVELEKYKMKLKQCMDKQDRYEINKGKVFVIVMGQCHPIMRSKLESLQNYKEMESKSDVIGLLDKIKELVYNTESSKYEFWTMATSLRKLVLLEQGRKESIAHYGDRCIAQVEVTEGVMGALIPQKFTGKKSEEQEKARNKLLACMFLTGIDRDRFKKALDDLNNDFVNGKTNYPEDIPSAVELLSNRRGDGGPTTSRMESMQDGVVHTSFLQNAGNRHKNLKCNNCKQVGHIKKNCPELKSGDDTSDEKKEEIPNYFSSSTKRKPVWWM